ncbi:hypothetical protein DEJ13_11955 [Curtobacterium sp. MCLR17_007]|uniref:TadE/TadG family type IV pilus assembly protein n=1 Tax=unclassified Curtobacterium TaxID=257496 RepID=UPI0006FFD7A8|nr:MULTISPECIES: TadE/TadG family type IV pilus assembly protein [unclassified Curtobacterium]KQS14400.1 hypothetical protein ASG04_00465 [Curtobacterium sp. Leaf183]WIB59166.1 hypothetical protein DEJ13_11955 [Curtobacterium sp. MCLR17_007]
MTVEFALALPVVAVVVTVAVAGVLLVDTQGRLQLAAATASRAIGRGDAATGQAALAGLGTGTSSAVTHRDGLVCVRVERQPAGPLPVVLRGDACAANGGG